MPVISKRVSPGNKAEPYFESLHCLRGVASILALLGHASVIHFGKANCVVPHKLLAVIFFFMLSGFVICYSYGERIRTRSEL